MGSLVKSVTLPGAKGVFENIFPILMWEHLLDKNRRSLSTFPDWDLNMPKKAQYPIILGVFNFVLDQALPTLLKAFSPLVKKALPQHPREQERATKGRLES